RGPMAPARTLDARASLDVDDAAGHAAFDRARFGDWNVFWVHPALYHENAPGVSDHMALPGQQDRRRDYGDIARRPPAPRARDVFLAIQTRDVGLVPSRPATPWISPRLALGFHGMDDLPDRRPADPGRVSFLCRAGGAPRL